jgi:hypothetical protein
VESRALVLELVCHGQAPGLCCHCLENESIGTEAFWETFQLWSYKTCPGHGSCSLVFASDNCTCLLVHSACHSYNAGPHPCFLLALVGPRLATETWNKDVRHFSERKWVTTFSPAQSEFQSWPKESDPASNRKLPLAKPTNLYFYSQNLNFVQSQTLLEIILHW